MKYEEYEEKIKGLITNPDTAMTSVDGILDSIKSDVEAIESMRAALDEKDARIKDLQDTNMKLFINASSSIDDTVEEETDWSELEGEEALDTFLEKKESED